MRVWGMRAGITVQDIVGLYIDLPAHAMVLSVDEKSQLQALDRTQPGLPLKPGRRPGKGRSSPDTASVPTCPHVAQRITADRSGLARERAAFSVRPSSAYDDVDGVFHARLTTPCVRSLSKIDQSISIAGETEKFSDRSNSSPKSKAKKFDGTGGRCCAAIRKVFSYDSIHYDALE
jgi:hypothetical protein